ncbi:MAG TPA: tetratricopeptide repeat protein [Burkholderiaceae bacterium]
MDLKNAVAIVTLSLLLSACAGMRSHSSNPSVAPDAMQNPMASQAAPPPEFDGAPLSTDAAGLPVVPLTGQVMYLYLASEIAFQRGEWESAFRTMEALARQTHDPRLAQRSFEFAWSARQPEAALDAAKLWRSLAPHSEEAMQNYLNSVVLTDELDEAQEVFERGLREEPAASRGSMIFQIQRLLAHAKDKDAAFNVLQAILAPYPDLVETHLALAYGAYAKNDNQRAQEEAQIALKARPDSQQAALILAQVNPDRAAAMKFLARFIAAHPTAKELRIAYARGLVEQKHYKEAEHELATLLKGDPENLAVLYMLGILEAQTNDNKAAERHLSSFIEVLANRPGEDRDATSALELLSQIAEERKDYDTALHWLDMIDAPDAHVGVEIRRAGIFARKGNLDGARKVLADLAPEDKAQQVQVIAANAQILREANRAPEAMTVLEEGIKRFPDNTDLMYDYAMDAEKAGRLDVCESMLRKVIALTPDNQQAYNALGYTFAERNVRLDEAYTLVQTALKLAPDDPFIVDSMGWVQFRLGRLKEAEDLLRRAYAIRPDPEIAVHLGEVLWVKGQKADAHKLWREVGSKDPDNDALKSTLARLHVSL